MKHELAVLAAWLHDIGKFAQRAGAPASQGMEQEYCPHGGTHRHVLHTDYFIEHVLPLPPEWEGERGCLARTAAAHHRPDSQSRVETALQKADQLSSGGDRMEGTSGGDFRSARLESIFHTVRLDDKGIDAAAPPLRYHLLPLDAEDAPIFPRPETDGKDAYARLYASFCQAVREIPCHLGPRHYLHSLTTTLERFTWCIPSSTYGTRADISLYDHAATTAAIAQAWLHCPEGRERFLLFGADLGGIQKFIFGENAHADGGDKGAGKLLRARSFMLQALTRSVWLHLLNRLELTHAARIMDAGGRFVLLLPDTQAVHTVLDDLEVHAEHWLLQQFQGTVRMTFARLPLEPDDLLRQRFARCFERFNDALEQAKLRPFASLFREHLSAVLPVDHEAYRQFGECALCRMRPASAPQEDGEERMCPQCRHLVQQVGRRLPRARYLVFSRTSDGLPLYGGIRLRLEEEAPATGEALDIVSIRDRAAFSAAPVAGFIPTVQEEDLYRWEQEGRLQHLDGTPHVLGEPCHPGDPKTFTMLAAEARIPPETAGGRWRSLASLAVCKADVDNLGLLFGMGFGTGETGSFSISRFAMLSRMMNHFFSAHLMRVIAREFPNIYVIFAGGDDLFVLGPWSETIAFAQRLHQDFTAFSGNNPAVTLSAGLPVVKPRLPVRVLREAAEQALERSKEEPAKNAVTLFGVTATWPLFHQLLEDGRWLEDLCLRGLVTQGLVRRMLGYARKCRDFTQGGDIRKGLYLSHLAYDMARNGKDLPPHEVQRLTCLGQDKDLFPKAELGITWALYRTRISG